MCAPYFEADLGASRAVGLDGDDRGNVGLHEIYSFNPLIGLFHLLEKCHSHGLQVSQRPTCGQQLITRLCEELRVVTPAMALFPLEGARAHQGLSNARARRSLLTVTGR
jgi:hypothetical protein